MHLPELGCFSDQDGGAGRRAHTITTCSEVSASPRGLLEHVSAFVSAEKRAVSWDVPASYGYKSPQITSVFPTVVLDQMLLSHRYMHLLVLVVSSQ